MKQCDLGDKNSAIWAKIRLLKGSTGGFPLTDKIYDEDGKTVTGKKNVGERLAQSFFKKANRLREIAQSKQKIDFIANFKKHINTSLITNTLSKFSVPSDGFFESELRRKNSKATDFNGFNQFNFKYLAKSMKTSLQKLAKSCFEHGKLPSEKVFPFYPVWKKKVDLCDLSVKNARPIGQVDNIVKSVITSAMTQVQYHVRRVLDIRQFGFKAKKCCSDLIMTLLCEIYSNLEMAIILQFYDFSSAFSMLDFDIMGEKLANYKFSGTALEFLNDLLQPRTSFMVLDDFESSKMTEQWGVIQGCTSGPPLFNLYTNDMQTSEASATRVKYADDTSDKVKADSWKNALDGAKKCKDEIQAQTDCNLLALDPKKSSVMIPIVTEKNKRLGDFHLVAHLTNSEKLLGIMMDSFLTFRPHVSAIMSKLGESTKILNALKSILVKSDLIIAARNLINSNLDFSAEIYALAADSELKRIQLQVNKMGRIVLKKSPTDHVSNFSIYSKLNVYPVRVLVAIKTMTFWKKRLDSSDRSDLKTHIESAFANDRKTSFKNSRDLIFPLVKLKEKYDFYVEHCRATNKAYFEFNSPNFTKNHLDSVFSDYRSNRREFSTLSASQKRGQIGQAFNARRKKIKPSNVNFDQFLF